MKKIIYMVFLIMLCTMFSISDIKADKKICYDYIKELYSDRNLDFWKKDPSTVTCEYDFKVPEVDSNNWHIMLYNNKSKDLIVCLNIEDGKPITNLGNFHFNSFNYADYIKKNGNWPELYFPLPNRVKYYYEDGCTDMYWHLSYGSRGYRKLESQSDCPSVTFDGYWVHSLDKRCFANSVYPSNYYNSSYRSTQDETNDIELIEKQPTASVIIADISYRGEELKIVYIIGIALLMIRIIVPILLIITGMIGLVKTMTKKDDRDIKAELKKLVPKLLAAIIIFVLPTLISGILSLVKQNDLWRTYSDCLLKPTTCDVQFDWK